MRLQRHDHDKLHDIISLPKSLTFTRAKDQFKLKEGFEEKKKRKRKKEMNIRRKPKA